MGMVERVALVVEKADPRCESHESIAKDVIAAMRVPTPKVLEMLEHLLDTQGYDQKLEESWGLLIDAALSDG